LVPIRNQVSVLKCFRKTLGNLNRIHIFQTNTGSEGDNIFKHRKNDGELNILEPTTLQCCTGHCLFPSKRVRKLFYVICFYILSNFATDSQPKITVITFRSSAPSERICPHSGFRSFPQRPGKNWRKDMELMWGTTLSLHLASIWSITW
jgi:hypothetical protein